MPRTEDQLREDFAHLRAAFERRTTTPPVATIRERARRQRQARVAVPVMSAVVAGAVLSVVVRAVTGLGGPAQESSVAVATLASSGPAASAPLTPEPTRSDVTGAPQTGPSAPAGPAPTGGVDRQTSSSSTRGGQALTISPRPASPSGSASSASGGGGPTRPAATSAAPVPTRPAPVPVPLENADFETKGLLDGVILVGSPVGWSGGTGLGNPSSVYYSGLARGETTGTMAGPNVASVTTTGFFALTQRTSTPIHAGTTYRLTVAVGGRTGGGFSFGGAQVSITASGAVVATTSVTTPPAPGSFGDVTVVWTATAADEGRMLGVSLDEIDHGALTYADFDNVRLTAQAP